MMRAEIIRAIKQASDWYQEFPGMTQVEGSAGLMADEILRVLGKD